MQTGVSPGKEIQQAPEHVAGLQSAALNENNKLQKGEGAV